MTDRAISEVSAFASREHTLTAEVPAHRPRAQGPYRFEISSAAVDEDWDHFVEQVAGGSHRQSSRWAQLKAVQGWEARRLLIRRDGRVVAGAQLFFKSLPLVPFFGNMAYCANGPLVAEDDPQLRGWIMDGIRHFCRRERAQVFIVQPPAEGPSFEDLLVADGCVVSPVPVAPQATVLVDLTPDLSAIEQRLGKSLRKQLRRADRRGVRVRRGEDTDLATFYRLLTAASDRLGYTTFPASYYQRLWDVFATIGQAQLFLAEYDDRVISAGLCLVFGDRVISTAVGWSGEDGHLNPNDLLDWHTIRWAKRQGLRYLELENFSYELARRLVEGTDPAELEPKGSDGYKLKWSTEVVLCPRPHLYIAHPVARTLVRRLPERMLRTLLQTLATRFRPMAEG